MARTFEDDKQGNIYEYDEQGNLICFGFRPTHSGKMEKTTIYTQPFKSYFGVVVEIKGPEDGEYVFETRNRRDKEWDSRYWEWWNDDKIDKEKYPPSQALIDEAQRERNKEIIRWIMS